MNLPNRINETNKQTKMLYRQALINPDQGHGAKIPSPIPQESATALLKYNFNISTNDKGNFLMIMDPFSSKVHFTSENTLDGLGTSSTFSSVDLPINSTIIDMWRLVSASISISYTGPLHNSSGYLLGASTSNVSNATNDTWLNFTNIEDISNKMILNPLDGCKLVYIPADSSQFDYYKVSDYTEAGNVNTRWKSCLIICGSGLPISTNCIRVDITKNLEYVSKTSVREYIHHTEGNQGTPDGSMFSNLWDYAVRSAKDVVNDPLFRKMQTDYILNHLNRGPY